MVCRWSFKGRTSELICCIAAIVLLLPAADVDVIACQNRPQATRIDRDQLWEGRERPATEGRPEKECRKIEVRPLTNVFV